MIEPGLPTHKRYDTERRVDARVEVQTLARLLHDDGTLEGEVENLSAGGASFTTRDASIELADGARIVLRAGIVLPSGERQLERRGAVVRCDDFFDGETDVLTYAISFDEPLTDSCFDETD